MSPATGVVRPVRYRPGMTSKPLTYKDAGVDIEAGNALVERIKPLVKQTSRPEVLAGLGGFGGLFALDRDRYREPVLVSGTDGVGTKLMLAQQSGRHDTIGIDLVAMCVNDVLWSRARNPCFSSTTSPAATLIPILPRTSLRALQTVAARPARR